MCYVRLTPEQMAPIGRERTTAEEAGRMIVADCFYPETLLSLAETL
jgi:hypothetical protein